MPAPKFLRYAWRSYTVFCLFEVPVQVHSTWLLFPCGLLLLSCSGSYGWAGLLFGILFLALLLASLLTHEFAHVIVAKKLGCNTNRVLVFPFGAIAELEEIPLETGEIRVAAAGPLASLVLAALAWGAAQVVDGPFQSIAWHAHLIFVSFAVLNLGLACFNLLPCFPMDGGRILRAALAIAIGLFFPHRASSALLVATRIAVRYVARTIAIGMIFLTIFYTHLWHHILLFGFLILVGEIEFWLVRQTSRSSCGELRFLPMSKDSLRKPRRARPFQIYPLTTPLACAAAEPCDTVRRTARTCSRRHHVTANAGVAKWQTHRT